VRALLALCVILAPLSIPPRPLRAAWAFALSSLNTFLIFPIDIDIFQQALKRLYCALLFAGATAAALAMLKKVH
jgi:hypothetical protein